MGVKERSGVERAVWHEAVEVAEEVRPCKHHRYREVLAYASGADAGSDPGLHSLSLVTTHERIFDDIYPIHIEGGHKTASTFCLAVLVDRLITN
eukprot:6197523-Pleurochrysis_carterae.AAC.1